MLPIRHLHETPNVLHNFLVGFPQKMQKSTNSITDYLHVSHSHFGFCCCFSMSSNIIHHWSCFLHVPVYSQFTEMTFLKREFHVYWSKQLQFTIIILYYNRPANTEKYLNRSFPRQSRGNHGKARRATIWGQVSQRLKQRPKQAWGWLLGGAASHIPPAIKGQWFFTALSTQKLISWTKSVDS